MPCPWTARPPDAEATNALGIGTARPAAHPVGLRPTGTASPRGYPCPYHAAAGVAADATPTGGYTGTRSRSSLTAAGSRPIATCSSSLATSAVQPVWWLAPTPAPVSPWKYSWKRT
jgi:hypothetical protein